MAEDLNRKEEEIELSGDYKTIQDPKFDILKTNRFLIEFEKLDIPCYCVKAVCYSNGNLIVDLVSYPDIFFPEIFDEKKENFNCGTVTIRYLDRAGVEVARTELTNVIFLGYGVSEMDYQNDDFFLTTAKFRYKDVKNKSIGKN